jgi:hypothetical protein
MIGCIVPYTFTTRDYREYSAIPILHTFQFTVTYALGFSVFTSRIQATDLSQSHCNITSHMGSFLHSLITFLPLFCSCQFRRRDSIQFLCSHAHILAGWRLETRLFTRLDYSDWSCLLCPFITPRHRLHRKHSLCC